MNAAPIRRRALRGVAAVLFALVLPHASRPAHAREPRLDYMLQCQGCHRADGSGAPGVVPDLRGSVGRFLLIAEGREYLVRVPGSAQSPLDDAALAAVLNWMVQRFGPAEVARNFSPFVAEEVARLRRAPLVEVAAVRRELLARLAARGPAREPGH